MCFISNGELDMFNDSKSKKGNLFLCIAVFGIKINGS